MSSTFKLTKEYELGEGYQYQLFKFGHIEIIVMCDKNDTNLKCYKLTHYSIKQAIHDYHKFILNLKKQPNEH
jgi:hypothetical protein